MAFRELAEGLNLPDGATERFRLLEALGRMLEGTLYDDLPYSFEQEKANAKHIPLRERRPSVDFNLAYEITQDTLAELFGDEQFPTVQVVQNGEQNEKATEAIADLIHSAGIDRIVSDTYEEGVTGSAAVILHASDDGSVYFEILPGKFVEPVYRSAYSDQLVALVVTYPIDADGAEAICNGITEEKENVGVDTFWYRFVVGPIETIDYKPLSDERFAQLGENDQHGQPIEFVELRKTAHGFCGRTPVVYVKNLGGKQRNIDGPALWWPVRNLCIEIDYNLSQAGRGLRYGADPMLFVRQGDINAMTDTPAGYPKPAGGMAENVSDGEMVKGSTQTLSGGPGSDAKLLEISASGIAVELDFVKDLREYALEVLGGMKARSEDAKGASSGRALDRQTKPLRRLVRRQRRPYGNHLLLELIDLTIWGTICGAIDPASIDADLAAIPVDAKRVLEWPNDETLQGSDLLAHVQGIQLMAGGSAANPVQLISPEAAGAKLAADLGLHEPFPTIKGNLLINDPANWELKPTAGAIIKP